MKKFDFKSRKAALISYWTVEKGRLLFGFGILWNFWVILVFSGVFYSDSSCLIGFGVLSDLIRLSLIPWFRLPVASRHFLPKLFSTKIDGYG